MRPSCTGIVRVTGDLSATISRVVPGALVRRLSTATQTPLHRSDRMDHRDSRQPARLTRGRTRLTGPGHVQQGLMGYYVSRVRRGHTLEKLCYDGDIDI